jgi:ferrous iron transport protein A
MGRRANTMPQLEADVPATQTRTLDQMPSGSDGVIIALTGGRSLVSRLATLGFVPGGHLRMVQNYGKGPVIVLVRQSRCALGRGEAAEVIIEEARAA